MSTLPLINDGAGGPPTAARGLTQHALSAAFPPMSDEDFLALKDSIENIGVQNPITLFEGMVIDGMHRYRAAAELRMPCPTQELGDDVDPRDFVKAQNKVRRHLNAGQWAMIEIALWKWRPHGGVVPRSIGAMDRGFTPASGESFIVRDSPDGPKTAADLAVLAGVSTATIERAKSVASGGTDAVQAAVKAGEVSVERGAQIAKLPQAEQAAALTKPVTTKPRGKSVKPTAQGEPTEADKNAEEAHGDTTIAELLEETLAELATAQTLLAAAAADDMKAEAMKWRSVAETARRRENEVLGALRDREAEIKKHVNTLRRIGKAVGEEDTKKVAAAVEALAKKLAVIA